MQNASRYQLLTVFSVITLLAASACDNGIRVLNVAPAITAVGPLSHSDGQLTFTVWIYDYETDATDLEVTLIRGTSESPIANIGGDGTQGLTTSRSAEGRPHTLTWTPPTDIAEAEQIQLKLTPSDGDAGKPYTTALFSLQSGLEAP